VNRYPVYILSACIIAGLIFGSFENALWIGRAATIGAALYSALFASIPALVLGLIILPFGALLPRWRFGIRAIERWRELSSRDNENRDAVVRWQARIFSALLLIAIVPYPLSKALKYLWSLQEPEIAIELAVAVTVATAAFAIAAWTALPRLLQSALLRVDRRFRLPLPPQAPSRILLFFALPAIAIAAPFSAHNRDTLGHLVIGIHLVMVAILAIPFISLLARFQGRSLGFRSAVYGGVVILWMLSVVVGIAAYDRFPDAGRAGEAGPIAGTGAQWLRYLSDFDRDSSPAILGGADCAPFDRSRGPRALDIPGNGIDENCDGRDARKSDTQKDNAPLRLVYGRLPPNQIKKYNIIWVIVDAIRADHVSAFGYRVPTTPSFDAFAAEGWLFSNAYSQSSATLLSFPSFLTGRNPCALEWEWYKGRPQLKSIHRTIAERLRDVGYRTGAVLNRYATRRAVGIHQGYDEVITIEARANRYQRDKVRDAPIAATEAIRYIESGINKEGKGKPFFLTAFFPDPHAPYELHSEINLTQFGRSNTWAYDQEIAFADRFVGFFVDYVRNRQGLWDNTIFIINSDHGEEFLERGNRFHARTCHEESVHVPFAIVIPGMKPQRIDSPVALVDVLPTLFEVIGVALAPSDTQDGQSLLIPALAPQWVPADRPIFCFVVSQQKATGNFYRRSLRSGGFAYFDDLKSGESALYDTAVDPQEMRDISRDPTHRVRLESMKAQLEFIRTGNLGSYADF
jgi:arylsulfatase A-like enzyme